MPVLGPKVSVVSCPASFFLLPCSLGFCAPNDVFKHRKKSSDSSGFARLLFSFLVSPRKGVPRKRLQCAKIGIGSLAFARLLLSFLFFALSLEELCAQNALFFLVFLYLSGSQSRTIVSPDIVLRETEPVLNFSRLWFSFLVSLCLSGMEL